MVFPSGFSGAFLGRVLVSAPFLQQQAQRRKPEFPGGRIFIAPTEMSAWAVIPEGQTSLESILLKWSGVWIKARGFSPPQRWALSTWLLLRMMKGNNCALTTRIDISKWKRNGEQILGVSPLMRMDFPGWQPFWKSDYIYLYIYIFKCCPESCHRGVQGVIQSTKNDSALMNPLQGKQEKGLSEGGGQRGEGRLG